MFFVTTELTVAEVPLKLGTRLAKIDFFGIFVGLTSDFWSAHLLIIYPDGLTWEKYFEKNYRFHK